jgi:outer membrane protein TolC
MASVGEPLAPVDATLINLPTALSMVGGDHPAVALARWRVQEAYAELDQAEVLWLPSLQAGFSFHRHDGNYQASNGAIVDVNRNSLQFGLGNGATGAGTTPRPGVQASFHLADAIFQPKIARRNAWAHGHAENAVVNRQLLEVALAYLGLLEATQRLRIVEQSRERVAQVADLTEGFAAAGQGLQADADRMQTELALIDARIVAAEEEVELASSALTHALSAPPGRPVVALDSAVVPLHLVPMDRDRDALIHTGLNGRPELKELQALVAAACEQHKRQQMAPFVPSVMLGLSAGGFGGGVGDSLNNVDERYDFDALVTWEVRNLGFGERAARRRSSAQLQQAMFRKVRRMDDVAREITDAHAQVLQRDRRMAVTERAIQSAENSFTRNLSRIRDGQGLPLEVLQSVQALEDATLAYADAVIAYNEAQFRLQWAMGWKVSGETA